MNAPSPKHIPRLVFIPLILVYVIYSIPGIDRPWGNDHNGFLAKEKSGFAINYLKLGLWNTKLAQKMDEGGTLDSSQKRYSYYIRHPMGISLLTALSFKLFGVKEWASRLVPVLLNVATLTLLYLFFETYWGRKTALLALFFVVFSPMLFYIRHLLAFELLALFFISAILYLYAKWDTTGHRRYGSLLVATASLGMLLSDWQVYFLAPGLVTHQLLFAKAKEKKILLLLPLAGLMFLIYMAYVIWLTGSSQGEGAGGWLWSNMLLRMNLSDTARSANITAAKWVAFFLRYYHYFYTTVLSALTALFFGLCLAKMIPRKRLTEQEGLLVCYFLAITSYFMVFSHAYMCCEFMTLFFLPVSGLFGATVIFAILGLFEGTSPFWTRKTISWGLIGGSVYLFLVLGYPQAKTVYTIQNMDLPLNNFFAHHKDDIIVAFDEDSSFYQLRPYLQLRTVKRIQTLDELRRTLADRGARFCYAVLKRGAPVDQELRKFLSTTYSSRLLANSALEEYDFFELRSAGRSGTKRGIVGR